MSHMAEERGLDPQRVFQRPIAFKASPASSLVSLPYIWRSHRVLPPGLLIENQVIYY